MFDLEMWRTLTLASAALGQTCFTLLYVTFPWWRNFLGRALFYKAMIFCVFTDTVFAARVFGFGANDQLFVTLYGLLGVGIWWQFVAFLRVKGNNRAAAKADPDHKIGGLT